MANGFLTGTATLTNGSNIMTLSGGVDASHVTSGSRVDVSGFLMVEGLSGSVGQILLRENWAGASQSGAAFVVSYTIEGLVDAVEKSRVISTEWQQTIAEVDAVIAGASTAVTDLTALEADITTAQTDLGTIQGSLDADKLASANSATAAAGSATSSGINATNAATSETNAGTSETNAGTSATNAATSETNAGTSAGTATAGATNSASSAAAALLSEDLAELWAINPEDTAIPGTSGVGFSALHYSAKAALIAGGTAPDTVLFGGQPVGFYAKTTEISNIDNTSDLDKPISTATKAITDKNKIFALAVVVM